MDLYKAEKGDLITSKINVHQGALALADRNLVCSTHYQVYEIDKNLINPNYLAHILRSNWFQIRVNEIKNGGIKNEQGADFLMSLEIPLPSIEEQNDIVDHIEKQKAIIEGSEKVLSNWVVDDYLDLKSNEKAFSNIAIVDGKIIKDEGLQSKKNLPYIGGQNIETGTGYLKNIESVEKSGIIGPSYFFKKGQVVYSKVRPNLRKCFLASFEGVCSSDVYPLTVIDKNTSPEYFSRVLQSNYFANKTQVFQGRAGMPKINRKQLYSINISMPDYSKQLEMVKAIQSGILVLEGLKKMKSEAEKKIEKILADIWGVELNESIKTDTRYE